MQLRSVPSISHEWTLWYFFCSYFKVGFPKSTSLVCFAQATCWEVVCPAAGLCSLSISVRCHRTSTSRDLANKNEVKPIKFSTECKYINVATVIKLSPVSACPRDLLLARKLIRTITRSVLHLCFLVFIQLFQLSGFVNFYISGCAPSHQEMSSGVSFESNALWFSLMPAINVSGNQAAEPLNTIFKMYSRVLKLSLHL